MLTTIKPETVTQEWERLWAHYVAKLARVDEALAHLNERPNRDINAAERALTRAVTALHDFSIRTGTELPTCVADKFKAAAAEERARWAALAKSAAPAERALAYIELEALRQRGVS